MRQIIVMGHILRISFCPISQVSCQLHSSHGFWNMEYTCHMTIIVLQVLLHVPQQQFSCLRTSQSAYLGRLSIINTCGCALHWLSGGWGKGRGPLWRPCWLTLPIQVGLQFRAMTHCSAAAATYSLRPAQFFALVAARILQLVW